MRRASHPFRLTDRLLPCDRQAKPGVSLMNRTIAIVTGLALAASLAVAAGVDKAAIDRSTPPGTDFWQYANGAWVKRHPIPADRSSYGVGAELTELANKRTAELIQQASRGA